MGKLTREQFDALTDDAISKVFEKRLAQMREECAHDELWPRYAGYLEATLQFALREMSRDKAASFIERQNDILNNVVRKKGA